MRGTVWGAEPCALSPQDGSRAPGESLWAPAADAGHRVDAASMDIPEDVALAVLLHAVASRIDPTGELYMKLCSTFELSLTPTERAHASTLSPLHSPPSAVSPAGLSCMDSLDLSASAASSPSGDVNEGEAARQGPTIESPTVDAEERTKATWGVGMGTPQCGYGRTPDPLRELRDAQLLGANLPSLESLLFHLRSLGHSEMVQRVRERVLAAVPAALIRPRFRPLRWKLGSVLGKGAFGECRMALCEDSGALFAVKTVPMGGPASSVAASVRSVQREVEVLRGVSHPHIVDMFAVTCAAASPTPAALCDGCEGGAAPGATHEWPGNAQEEPQQDRQAPHAQGHGERGGLVLNIAMEYMEGGSLAKLIEDFGALPEPVVASYARQIVLGLEYLHALGVVHADIKPANCLLDKSGLLKLSDFGCAQRIVSHSSVHASTDASAHDTSRPGCGLGLQVVPSRAELDKLNDMELSDGGEAVLGCLVCAEKGASSGKQPGASRPLIPEGTPNYMPSEVVRYREYSDKGDVWALGLTVLECLTGDKGQVESSQP